MKTPVKIKNKKLKSSSSKPEKTEPQEKEDALVLNPPEKKEMVKRKRHKISMLDVRRLERLERRRNIMNLRMLGHTLEEVAQKLQLSTLHVARELEALREENAERMKDFDRTNAVLNCVSVFEQIEAECWKNYRATFDVRNKNTILNTIRAARNDQIKLLEDLGFLSKAPTQVNHNIEAQASLQDMTDKTQQLLAMAFMQAQLKPLPEPIPDDNLPILEASFNTEEAPSQHQSEEKLKELFGELELPLDISNLSDEEIFGSN